MRRQTSPRRDPLAYRSYLPPATPPRWRYHLSGARQLDQEQQRLLDREGTRIEDKDRIRCYPQVIRVTISGGHPSGASRLVVWHTSRPPTVLSLMVFITGSCRSNA